MSGALLAAASGVGFGLFQSVNVRAVRASEDPYASTFVQVVIATAALVVAALLAGDLGRLPGAPASSLAHFAIGGLLHFLAGWSLLNLSQQRIGAARTSPLLTTAPVFGIAVAAITPGQLPGPAALGAIALMCVGAYVVAARGGLEAPRLSDSVPGLACAFMWAVSPVFILHGLEGYDDPLVGLTVGLVVSSVAYLAVYAAWRGSAAWPAIARSMTPLKTLVGVLVAVATWWRWAALQDATVGAVLALGLLSVPIVLVLAPVLSGRHLERVTAGLWAGASLVVGGALLLVLA